MPETQREAALRIIQNRIAELDKNIGNVMQEISKELQTDYIDGEDTLAEIMERVRPMERIRDALIVRKAEAVYILYALKDEVS